jgi:hypothetical protein
MGCGGGILFIAPSERWVDPRAKLLQGPDWAAVGADVCRTLGRSATADDELANLQTELDAAYRRTAEQLPRNTSARIERHGGRDTLVVTGLDRLEEPASLLALRRRAQRALPRLICQRRCWRSTPGPTSAPSLRTSVRAALGWTT